MGLLKHFRSKSRLKVDSNAAQHLAPEDLPPLPSTPARFGRDCTARLPERVISRIFTFVCPHVQDFTYQPSESSEISDGCMLCDLRDLANCAQVSRRWYGLAQKLLYTSVRIDAVHYCALEDELAEKRKKTNKSLRSKNHVEPGDIPTIRLQLLARTVRIQPSLGNLVLLLKLPYMTRETAKGDLARTVSALPNLRYVDLPDGFYTGDPSCLTLRQELQTRCPDIRKMTYKAGAEEALELLAQRYWQSLEILDLNGLAVEPATLRIVLASLPALQDLTMSNMGWLDDTIFQHSMGNVPDFPPLQGLKMVNVPRVTAQGLKTYVGAQRNKESLFSLTLQNTGVTVAELSQVLWGASSLEHLSITEIVTRSLALSAQELPPLTSISLKTLHFEITSSEDVHGLQRPAESYYAYLATSLHQNALPALQTLYVRDQGFPDLLLMSSMSNAPPLPNHRPSFATGTSPNASEMGSLKSKMSNMSFGGQSAGSNTKSLAVPANGMQNGNFGGGGFNQNLEIFSKGIDELEWVFTAISPPSPSRARAASGGRPLSAYSASRGLGPQWAQGGFGGEARKSVVVGNGFGGFLAIPQEEAPGNKRPMSSVSDGAGGTRWGSIGTQGSGDSSLKPPPSIGSLANNQQKRGSRHDLWR